ncbi:50S ribosomal protein L11 [Candidatus Collierbacteria bacterium RIFOXYB1_FULL_49_13]|uniref:Large ribosomal subunit protein uL11 n=1 Tax=Candidatus Collierbacteria bacterium RIFOXYB1_FULL_49_13 TaxID=1817728 RepID=A0A1F5FJR5_9BACT|nr:MAG: 50S ribosomal protein L11 [Candidatus Collierbacteria bacterium RIFOXYB1_FULL_49_13]
MAKKIKVVLKLNLQAGAATPAPPTGPALGQHGVNIMEFVTQYNKATEALRGQVVPAVVTIFEDRTFSFVTKLAPVAELIKQTLKITKAAGNVKKDVAGTLTQDQVKEIAEKKLGDMNTTSLDSAIKSVLGTARSMGVKIK